MDLVSLEKIFSVSFVILTKGFIIFGGSLAYVFQYKEIYEREDASGFSLFVCLTLLIANILRIMFWFGKRFELALVAQSVVMLISMILMLEISYLVYVEILGLIALLSEACLGFPQLRQNCTRRSTSGMSTLKVFSIGMVLVWIVGDCGKTAYFIYESSPAQFWLCGIIQITTDLLIMLQVYCFGKRATRSRVQLPQVDD
uniref:Solute carrier family 66 member 2 n=1 Tax=Setaria digitata TaxID=48799 RepID=A0A915PPU1_9BILA